MNTLKGLSATALVALVVAVGVFYLTPSKTIIVDKLGATPGTEISGDSFTVNGVRHVSKRVAFAQATSTLCAIPAPIGTSTLAFFSVKQTSIIGTSSQVTVDLFRSSEDRATTTAYATSSTNMIGSTFKPDSNSLQGYALLGATTTGNILTDLWSNSGALDLNGGDRHDIFVAKLNNPALKDYAHTFSPTGFCQAEWVIAD